MAYFSNGTEGAMWEAENCAICVLGQQACPIQIAHLQGNYDQYKGDGNQLAMDILNILIPRRADGYASHCAMRVLLEQTITKTEPVQGLILLPGFRIVQENGGSGDDD
ncbi:hypothetical protein [uncultured Pseudodesulfovibrio sp.]|uniref:hypothetical protein n=1 Tax=uncultured Pseudodesulfovibrio sp. TaxID=2035858 RepID=UPI0029C973B4|nr:hypothetical protein [uncultured Pseudodesulfovibrio sp.]